MPGLFLSLLLLLFGLIAPPQSRAQPDCPEQPPLDTLQALLPGEVDGLVLRGVNTQKIPPIVRATYRPVVTTEGRGRPFKLTMAYGETQQIVRQALAKARAASEAASTVTVDGHTVHVLKDSLRVGAFVFPGCLAVLGEMEARSTAGAESWREQIVSKLRALDLEGLDAFRPLHSDATRPDSATSSPPEGPERLSTYTANFGGLQVRFDHPSDWHVVDLYRRTAITKSVVAMRDPQAASKMLAEGRGLTTERPLRLLTPDNVGLAVSVVGEGQSPKAFLENAVEQAPLKQPEVVHPPSSTNIPGWSTHAYEARIRGKDADGRSVLWRPVAFSKNGTLFLISVLQPAPPSEATKETVQTLIRSIEVTG